MVSDESAEGCVPRGGIAWRWAEDGMGLDELKK